MKVVILTLFVYSNWIIRFDIELHDVISMKEKAIKVHVWAFIACLFIYSRISRSCHQIDIIYFFGCRHKDEIVSDIMELSTDVTSIVGEILLVLLQRFHLNIAPLLKPLHGLFYGLGLHVKFNCLDKDLM